MDNFDPYRFDTPDSYALKTGDYSTGGLTDPARAALPAEYGTSYVGGWGKLSLTESAVAVGGVIVFLGLALLSW